jgi:hypothetical protein
MLPGVNSNAAYFSSGLDFDFHGTKYQLINASADGKQISIQRIKTSPVFQTANHSYRSNIK